MKNKNDKNLRIGYNTFWSRCGSPAFDFFAKREKGADFVFCHYELSEGTAGEQYASAEKMAEAFNLLGVDFVANIEQANFAFEIKTADGHSWTEHGDGTHRFEFTGEMIDALASQGNLIGVAYDELEHCIVNRNASLRLASRGKTDVPVFAVSETDDFLKQGELLSAQLSEYAKRTKNGHDIALSGEHVFPVLFHTFARNGITPNFKSQKESYSNVQFAVAAGAALQYNAELWNCVDLWYRVAFPGHGSGEMYHNLLFSYISGVNRLYVEHSGAFFEKEDKLNDFGKAYMKFLDEYKGRERPYDVSDYKPEIGIIRYDDTFWGQNGIMWKKMLFGNPKIKPDRRAREYTRAFHVITHGETCKNGISWDRISPWSLKKHRSFASMNGAAVFDDRVEKKCLEGLSLCFLCGCYISPRTIEAVEGLVRENGLTVITSKRFLPERLRKSGKREIADGKGKWIVTNNMASRRVKRAAKPFIGNKGEVHLRFGENDITMKLSEDANSFTLLSK